MPVGIRQPQQHHSTGRPAKWLRGPPAKVAVNLVARPLDRPVRVRLHEQPSRITPPVLIEPAPVAPRAPRRSSESRTWRRAPGCVWWRPTTFGWHGFASALVCRLRVGACPCRARSTIPEDPTATSLLVPSARQPHTEQHRRRSVRRRALIDFSQRARHRPTRELRSAIALVDRLEPVGV